MILWGEKDVENGDGEHEGGWGSVTLIIVER